VVDNQLFESHLTPSLRLLYPQEMVEGNPPPSINVTLPPDRAETLALVFEHLRPVDRRRQIDEALAYAPLPCLEVESLGGLIEARRNRQLVGAVFSQVEPGKTAALWLPRLIGGEPESTAGALLTAIWNFLSWQSVVLARVVLPMVDKYERTILRSGGIRHLADLLYLVGPKDSFPTARPRTQLDFEAYSAANHHRMAQVLEATYEGTLDCPGLDGVRDVEDVLASYRSTGLFDPRYWLLVRQEHRDVGCLLLADHPRHDNMELLYLGLIPAARGHGWGRRLVRYAQWLARLAGRRRLVLAVDAANAPALQTYMGVGFQAWRRRRLYVKQLRSADNWHASFQQVFHGGHPADARNYTATPASS
jgi:ribosomal protein S18 acetylase RimI-like enzyme